MAPRNDYIIATVGKKHLICHKKVGSKDGYRIFAETTSEDAAKTLLAALELHHGRKAEIETVAERTLAETREALQKERAIASDLRAKVRTLEIKETNIARDLAVVTDRAVKAENQLGMMLSTQHALEIELAKLKAPLEKV